MKYIHLIVLILWAHSFSDKLAVMPISGSEVSESLKESLTDRLAKILSDKGDTLIERQQLSLVMKEQGLQQITCEGEECLELGKVLKVDRLITGRLSRVNKLLSATIQMVDVKDAKVSKSVVFDWQGTDEGFVQQAPEQIVSQLKGDQPSTLSLKERFNWERPTAWTLLGLSGAGFILAWHFDVTASDAYDEFKKRADRGFSPSNQDIKTAQDRRDLSMWVAGSLALSSALFFWAPWVNENLAVWHTSENTGVMWSMSF